MKNIWSQSIAIPILVAVVVLGLITGIGEIYLKLGDNAIYLAIALMVIIAGSAAYFSRQSELHPEVTDFLGQSIWRQSIVIPIVVAVVVLGLIAGIGEAYLKLGDNAIYLAIALMVCIAGAAAYISNESTQNQP